MARLCTKFAHHLVLRRFSTAVSQNHDLRNGMRKAAKILHATRHSCSRAPARGCQLILFIPIALSSSAEVFAVIIIFLAFSLINPSSTE